MACGPSTALSSMGCWAGRRGVLAGPVVALARASGVLPGPAPDSGNLLAAAECPAGCGSQKLRRIHPAGHLAVGGRAIFAAGHRGQVLPHGTICLLMGVNLLRQQVPRLVPHRCGLFGPAQRPQGCEAEKRPLDCQAIDAVGSLRHCFAAHPPRPWAAPTLPGRVAAPTPGWVARTPVRGR